MAMRILRRHSHIHLGKYSFQAAWSDEDSAYIATCPEFPGLLAHGNTPEDAIKEAGIALGGVIQVYKDNGMKLPEPRLYNGSQIRRN